MLLWTDTCSYSRAAAEHDLVSDGADKLLKHRIVCFHTIISHMKVVQSLASCVRGVRKLFRHNDLTGPCCLREAIAVDTYYL